MALPIGQPMTQQQTFQQTGTFVQPNFMYSNCAFPGFGPQLQPQFGPSPLQQQLFQKQQELQQLQQQLQHEVQQAELQQLQCQIQQTQQQLLKQQQQRQQLQQRLPQIQQRQSLQPILPALPPHLPPLALPPCPPVPACPPKPPQPHRARKIQGPPPLSKGVALLNEQRTAHSNRNRHTICSPSTSQLHSLQVSPRTTSGLSSNAAPSSRATPSREMQRLSLASRTSFHSLQHKRLLSSTAPKYHHLNAAAASTTALLDTKNDKTRPPPVPTIPKHHHSNVGVSRTTALMDSKNVKPSAGPISTTPKHNYLKLAASSIPTLVSSKNATTRAGPVPTIPDHHNAMSAVPSSPVLAKPKRVTIVTGPAPSRYRRREVQPTIPQNAGMDLPEPGQSPRPKSVLKKWKSMDLMGTRKDKPTPSVASKDGRAWRISARLDGVRSRLGSSGRETQPLEKEALQSSLIKKPHTMRAQGFRRLTGFVKPKTEVTSDSSSLASIEATTGGSLTTDSTPPSSIMTCEGEKKIPKLMF
ncbi:uncharacterized protein J3D65DRAFT_620482 [Phyllosticta citribraziliensis]|uniref:Uncharacterized protein n=1 Tax=Phyllosticta citribraziliensis TaxID=989973 RepID=A0ABR1M1S7_9PEZI